jgi:prepilin-type N-terminal cleavage/methylation domain-containing protein
MARASTKAQQLPADMAVLICLRARRQWDARGFTLIELLIVVAIIAIVAAIAVPGFLRARVSANEASAVGSMRTINSAQATYSASCGAGGYAVDLADLAAAPLNGGPAFIPPDLAAAFPGGTPKSHYEFTVSRVAGEVVLAAANTCNGSANDTETEFFVNGDPIAPALGARHFGADHTGQIRQDADVIDDITDGVPLQ